MSSPYDIVRVYTATVGTGSPLALGAAVTTFRTPVQAGIADGAQLSYGIEDVAGNGREVGYGTYSAGAQTLTRNCTGSTNSNNPINLSGQAQIYVTALAADLTNAGNLTSGNLPFPQQAVFIQTMTAAAGLNNFGGL